MKESFPGKIIESNIDSSGIEKYLKSGGQTMLTPEILSLVEKVDGKSLEKILKILDIIQGFQRKGFNADEFRRRTAGEIAKSGYVTGCTDAGLVFIAAARAKGIPSKYIETIDKQWLEKGGQRIGGHIYAESFCVEDNKWVLIDPMLGKIVNDTKGRIIYKEGLDSWDIGITDYDSLKEAFKKFREEYKLNTEK